MQREVQIIKPKKDFTDEEKIRVAAYCRVSTDSKDQLNSFFAQMKYYNDYIKANDNMKLVDIYADEGISGLDVNKRDDFKRMLNDAKGGKIDRILVKSVQRFARNSLECIESVRILKSYGTNVYFENDKIDTEKMSSEMMLYIKSAFAQSESLSHSRRMSTAFKMKMQDGTFSMTKAPTGYELVNGGLEINPDEVEETKLVFKLYLNGMGVTAITKYMQQNHNGIHWTVGRVREMIRNEKYMGDWIVQKYYTPLQLPLKNVPNRGQVDQYHYENANEAIITKEEFEIIKEIRAKREKEFKKITGKTYFFSNKIRCRKCGRTYRKLNRPNQGLIWGCSYKGHSIDVCHAPNFKDEDIRFKFVKMYNILKANEKILLDSTITLLKQLKVKVNNGNNDIGEIDNDILTLAEQNKAYSNMFMTGMIDQSIYFEKSDKIKKKMTELHSRRLKLIRGDDEEQSIEKLKKLKRIMGEYPERVLEFNEKLFEEIVEKIFVEQDGTMCFLLLGGLELKVDR